MSKFWVFLVVIGIGALIWTGILEVNFNFSPGEVSDVPGVANTIVKEKTTYEKGRAYVIGLKRRGELFVVRNREKRLVLALLYVKNDSARLEELIDSGTSAEGLLPQTELLISSLNQVRTNAQKAPVEVVASLKKESAAAFSDAQYSLGRLQEQHQDYEKIQDEFERLTRALERQIGELGLEERSEEEVAGDQDGSITK